MSPVISALTTNHKEKSGKPTDNLAATDQRARVTATPEERTADRKWDTELERIT